MQPKEQGPRGEGPEHARLLVLAALSLPQDERREFLIRAAGTDATLSRTVLELLSSATSAGQTASAGESDTRVQSTGTDSLLQKLAAAPRLDGSRFLVEGEVGRGGMGLVMSIRDLHLNRRLAMKMMIERNHSPTDVNGNLARQGLGRFLEEAQVTSQLDHPGVIPVHDLGFDPSGKVYFTMRLVKGRSARAVFADVQSDAGDWNITRALEVILRVCDTVAYAHDRGVLHRDIKPDNVMVGKFGEVYVVDWGLAKVIGQPDLHDLRIKARDAIVESQVVSARRCDTDSDVDSSLVSMDGQQLGTPNYMPPEQARSAAVNERADIYSIGAMLYELLAGRPPYAVPGSPRSAYQVLDDLLRGPPVPIERIRANVPTELVAITEKAMARDERDRYQTVLELADDLRSYIAQRVVKAHRTGAIAEMRMWVRRNRQLAATLMAAVLVLMVGILVTTRLWKVAEDSAQQARESEKVASENSRRAQESAIAEGRARLDAQQSEAKAVEQERLARELAFAEGQARIKAQESEAKAMEQRKIAEAQSQEIAKLLEESRASRAAAVQSAIAASAERDTSRRYLDIIKEIALIQELDAAIQATPTDAAPGQASLTNSRSELAEALARMETLRVGMKSDLEGVQGRAKKRVVDGKQQLAFSDAADQGLYSTLMRNLGIVEGVLRSSKSNLLRGKSGNFRYDGTKWGD